MTQLTLDLDPDGCKHLVTEFGPNVPLRHGSYRSQVCVLCKRWRMVSHQTRNLKGEINPIEPQSEWKPLTELQTAITPDEEL